MSRGSMIGIALVGVALAVWGYLRSGGNDYADRDVALDSPEAQSVQAMMDQLRQSTNHLATCMGNGINPIAQQQLHQRATQIQSATAATVKTASWSGEYFRVQISSPTEEDAALEHWFLLAEDEEGELKLVGVQH